MKVIIRHCHYPERKVLWEGRLTITPRRGDDIRLNTDMHADNKFTVRNLVWYFDTEPIVEIEVAG